MPSSRKDDLDLDLLLSLNDDRVPESPEPFFHSDNDNRSSFPEFTFGDDGPTRRPSAGGMSVFRDAVKDYLDIEPEVAVPTKVRNVNKQKSSGEVVTEKFSGLRIRGPLVSPKELNSRFSDTRFLRLGAISCLMNDSLSGCWATLGVLMERGEPRTSSSGKSYCIWKMGCLDENSISVFLFGDAFSANSKVSVGEVFAIFDSTLRNDALGNGFSLSVYSAGQLLKLGNSADYGICKGKRKDGTSCTMVINTCKGMYCKFHGLKACQNYRTSRVELQGGIFRKQFRTQNEGIYMFDPQLTSSSKVKPAQRVHVLSVDGLKKVLSNSDKVTNKNRSQGIRFLTQLTAKVDQKPNSLSSGKRKPTECKKVDSKIAASASAECGPQPDSKRKKAAQQFSDKMIELDVVSSDEEVGS